MSPFLQSQDWAEFQKSQGRAVFDIDGANIIRHNLPFKKSWLYIPYGPATVTHDFVHQLKELARREHAIFVKAEPYDDGIAQSLVQFGFYRSTRTIQPHRTVVIDLQKSEDALLEAMHHKTRYNIHVAERAGIEVREGGTIGDFLALLKKTTTRDKFRAHPDEYYKRMLEHFANNPRLSVSLWFARRGDVHVAAALVLTYGNTAYYLHGASDYIYRVLMAPYALHWGITKSYKLEAKSYYDLWGIDANKWPGVTRFKLGWGGRTVEYPGTFDLIISRPWCWAYNFTHKLI